MEALKAMAALPIPKLQQRLPHGQPTATQAKLHVAAVKDM